MYFGFFCPLTSLKKYRVALAMLKLAFGRAQRSKAAAIGFEDRQQHKISSNYRTTYLSSSVLSLFSGVLNKNQVWGFEARQ